MSKKYFCKQCDYSKGSSNVYKVDGHRKGSSAVEVLKPVNTDFTAVTNFETYHLTPQSQRQNVHMSGKIAKWAKCMDVYMKSSMVRLSNPIFIFAFLHIFKTAYGSNSIHERAANVTPPSLHEGADQAALSYRMGGTENNNNDNEGKLTT